MLQDMIEEMWTQSVNQKVTIIAHSMGAPVILYFLNNFVSQKWKEQYIHEFIPIAGGWTGGNEGLVKFVSQINVLGNHTYLSNFTSSYRTMASSAWLLPNPLIWKDEVLIETNGKNYSSETFKEMFNDINRDMDYHRFTSALSINGDYLSPNVSTLCIYGLNTLTPEIFIYGNDFPQSFIRAIDGDGDGAVNRISSEVCLNWENQYEASFAYKVFNISHIQLLSEETVLDLIYDAIKYNYY